MTHFDARDEMLLELARTAREPSSVERMRNLDAVRARLGMPPVLRAPAVGLRARGGAATWQLVATAVVTGAVGVLIGFALGQRDSASPAEAVQVAEAPAGARSNDTRAAVAAAPVPDVPASRAPAAERSAALPRAKPRTTPPRTKSDAHPSAVDRTFLMALRLLERAEHALGAGEPALAASLLDELDARFPPALLDEERRATRALTWCALGERSRASGITRRLLEDNPRSIYAERLGQSCAAPSADK